MNEPKLYICSTCNMGFIEQGLILSPVQVGPNAWTVQWECPICTRSLKILIKWSDWGITKDLLIGIGISPLLLQSIMDMDVEIRSKDLIIDLCMDFFNRKGK